MSQMQSLDDPCSDRSEPLSHDQGENILITVLMPCLNESRTLAACIEQSHAGCRAALAMRSTTAVVEEQGSEPNLGYEIVIADNGSSDGSPGIALAHGARVVPVEQRGYGAALLGGIAAARGKYIVMGDSDCSYDFGEVPRFIAKLEEGFDLVVGNRFAGGIMPGAMPWHHRYIGNPVLSGIGRLLYRAPCRDWHCGLRSLRRDCVGMMKLCSPGMEFASEILISALTTRMRVTEIPVTLYPDRRQRRPHLRSFRDGLRHLVTLFRLAPNHSDIHA